MNGEVNGEVNGDCPTVLRGVMVYTLPMPAKLPPATLPPSATPSPASAPPSPLSASKARALAFRLARRFALPSSLSLPCW